MHLDGTGRPVSEGLECLDRWSSKLWALYAGWLLMNPSLLEMVVELEKPRH